MEGMKWSHLPLAGGLYDQHPQFLEELDYIFTERGKFQEKKRKEEERKSGKTPRAGRTAGRR